jgi:hypothetical protein
MITVLWCLGLLIALLGASHQSPITIVGGVMMILVGLLAARG